MVYFFAVGSRTDQHVVNGEITTIQEELKKVMPGAVYLKWERVFAEDGKIGKWAKIIRQYLSELPPEYEKLSSTKIKKALDGRNPPIPFLPNSTACLYHPNESVL